jgi:hypothetical protein
VNAGPQFPTGSAGDVFGTGFAIDGGYYYRAADAFFIGLSGGFHRFSGDGTGIDQTIIPINLALKYNFSLTGVQPYVGAETGPFFVSNGDSETNFGVVPRLGVRIPVSTGIDLDINLKYDVIFSDPDNFTYVGANGGFAYIIGRSM